LSSGINFQELDKDIGAKSVFLQDQEEEEEECRKFCVVSVSFSINSRIK
jgi:hypothetical protein